MDYAWTSNVLKGIPRKTPSGNEEHEQFTCKLLQSSEGITADCKKQGLTKVPSDLPTAVTALDISSNNIEILNETSFQSLHGLTTLSINANRVRIIKGGAFSPLLQLKRLYLNSNALSELRSDVFAHNYDLEVLQFAYNKFSVFPSDTLQALPNVHELSFPRNQIQIFCCKRFASPSITKLEMQNNKISNLSQECFLPFSKTFIQNINFGFNKLSSLPDYVFKYLKRVENIIVQHNFMTTFSFKPILGLTMLTALDFAYNRVLNITTIDHNATMEFPPLKNLTLKGNRLGIIPPAAFQGFDKLLWLHLGGNRIKKLSNDSFNGLDRLQTLILSGNKLDKFKFINVQKITNA